MSNLSELVIIYNQTLEQQQDTNQVESDILANLDQQFSTNNDMVDQIDLLPDHFINHNFQYLFRQSLETINHEFYIQMESNQLQNKNRTVVRVMEKAMKCLKKEEIFIFVRTIDLNKKMENKCLFMCWIYKQILQSVESKYKIYGQVLLLIIKSLVQVFRKYIQFIQKNKSQQMKSLKYGLMQQVVPIMTKYIAELLDYFKNIEQIGQSRLYSTVEKSDDENVKLKYMILQFLGDLIEGCSGKEIRHYVVDIDTVKQSIYDCICQLQKNRMELVYRFVEKYRHNWINLQRETNIMDKEEYGIDDGLNPKMIWHVIQNEKWELRYSKHYRLKVCCYLLNVFQEDKEQLVKVILGILGSIDINEDVYRKYDIPINGLFMQLIQFMGGPDNQSIKQLNSTAVQGLIDRMDQQVCIIVYVQKRRTLIEYLVENCTSIDLLGYLMFQLKQQIVRDLVQQQDSDLLDQQLEQKIAAKMEQILRKQQGTVGFAGEYSNYWLYLTKLRNKDNRTGVLGNKDWKNYLDKKVKQMEDMVAVGMQQKNDTNQWMIVNHTIELIREENKTK